ncbi:putative bacteriophage protein [Methylocella tundrae]|uniref:Putative bacteriophage protein n=1 Tax=Methylocella tundrae TaxID=227605 RepID=A0A8B6MBU4_METTU|nr:baseplate J/gp47 family protein [Methylocella tundrae]VTZ52473.1 putative bacteriophage protein [Methylocella tundrae]
MFALPALGDLYQRTIGAFRAYANLDASLPLNNVQPTAKVIAGRDFEIFGRMDYVGQQAFVLYADEIWLPKHASQYNMPRKPAALATGRIGVVSPADILVPAGTLFTRADGVQYAAAADFSLAAAGTLLVSVVAQATGALGNADAGTILTIGSGPTGNGASAATASVAAGGVIGGLDIEDLEAWRDRILFRLRYPPHGGAASDYVMWGRAVAGVTRVFVERLYRGPGTVRVFPIFDDLFAGTGGVATDPYIEAVIAAIAAQEPATAFVTVSAPTSQPIDIVATGVAPYTTSVKQAIVDELLDMMRRLGAVAGSDTATPSMPFLASPQVFSRSWIWQAIANASGEQRHVLALPSADIPIAPGAIPVLGSVDLQP